MKLSLLTAAAVAQLASAHYVFDTIVPDGVPAKTGQYVRQNTRQANYNPTTWENVRDDMTPDSTDFRCNKGAFTNAGKTQTLEVKAGSKVAMRLGAGSSMLHPGPGLVYMSKAPTTAQAYEGEGDWFKIFEQGVCDKTKDFTRDAWCTWGKDRIEFTIPKDLPDGEYLLRPEHIGIHGNHVGQAEFAV
ncbi:glycoside hydrolase [Phaeosphaeriaceae sp. PMI808]|nr:glycoside hydrolase [Phaeosphaeriaceae sp. PMI808]